MIRIRRSGIHFMDTSPFTIRSTYEDDSKKVLDYAIVSELGKGSFAQVFLATGPQSRKYALKKMSKKTIQKDCVLSEMYIGSSLKHPSIISHIELIEGLEHNYLVLEYFQGKELLTILEERQFCPMNERRAKIIIRQVVDALCYMHNERIAHRDLKPENILCNRNNEIKIVDLGFAVKVSFCNPKIECFLGSQDYASPEILEHKAYDAFKADVWSLGTIIFVLLFGEIPFSRAERLEAALHGTAHPHIIWPQNSNISAEAIQLISKMLEVDPNQRLTMFQVSKHPWLKNEELINPV
eukprot:TRINITY_DN3802_c0_g1_i2.p1 TRINITY_DN3802_c0_g1~~TRINITY_DN3802_c0_g1_i2.p1  ORF type:complete len:296 (-),score=52.51 TRINITY_DN3802_c0_g1_i2:9-896(-)